MSSFIIVVLFVAFCFFVWNKRRSLRVSSKNKNMSDQKNIRDITDGDGNFTLEVVGEYYNQERSKTFQNRTQKIKFSKFFLYPEPQNPHDKNAVAVVLGGELVGHLSRDDAKSYRAIYGKEKTSVLGIIQGGNVKNSIWLDANFGSGQGSENVFNKSSILQSFPVIAGKTSQYGANLARVMDGNAARIVEVELHLDDKKKDILVLVDNLCVAEIPSKNANDYENTTLPVKTLAIITSSSSKWTVKTSSKSKPL